MTPLRYLLLLCLLAVFAGCDRGLPTVPVSGTISFAGGPPPAAGSITFAPIEPVKGFPRRPGTGSFSPEDPTFTITSFQPGDGLVPGRYQVNISCYTGTPTSARPETYVTLNAVPESWAPKELVIEQGSGNVEVQYDIPPKK